MIRSSRKNVLQAAAVLVLLTSGIDSHAQYVPTTCRNSYTPQQEIALGQKVVAEVYKTQPVLPDTDPLTRYIQQLGDRLVSVAPPTPGLEQQWPFRFHVVASEEINAFAVPGGTMFVNLGAIQAAQTEAQLAGVMAHEMSHVILRHSTCNLIKQNRKSIWYSLGAIGSAIALGGDAGSLAAQGIGAAQGLDFLHMSRGDEQQADMLGVHILHDADFDPRGLPQFFEIIIAKYGRGGAQFLSDHPNPGNRTEYLMREIALMQPLQNPIKSTPAFTTAHDAAASRHALTSSEMKSGTWKTSGLYAQSPVGPASVSSTPAAAPTTAPPAPSLAPFTDRQLGINDRLVLLQAPRFAIRYPASWNKSIADDGTATLTPQGASGSFGVAYGVVLGIVRQEGDGVSDARTLAAATAVLQQRFQTQDGLTSVGAARSITVAGQAAMSINLRGPSPVSANGQPQNELDQLITVARPDGDLVFILFVAPERDAATLKPLFDSMLASFRPQ